MRQWQLHLIGALLLVGCADDESSTAPPATVEDSGCPAGQWERDGGCLSAGIPPDGCGVGFVHDGARACDVILPADGCRAGQMAVPGDDSCREVADCGSGDWGDIATGSDSEFVLQSFAGVSDGSMSAPWTTISEAVAAAAPGAVIALGAGRYLEDVRILEPVHLWGRCPSMVEIVGTGNGLATVLVLNGGAAGTALEGFKVTGPMDGVGIANTPDVTIRSLWIDGAEKRGLQVQSDFAPASVVVSGSLLSGNTEYGAFFLGAEATVDGSVVRDTRQTTMAGGVGLFAGRSAAYGAALTVRGSLIDHNTDTGIRAEGADLIVDSSVVANTVMRGMTNRGRGVQVAWSLAGDAPGSALVRGSLIEANHELGMAIFSSDAVIEHTVIRDMQPSLYGGGRGIHTAAMLEVPGYGTTSVARSAIFRSHEVGVYIEDVAASIDGVFIGDTVPREGDQLFGDGVSLWSFASQATVTLSDSHVDESARAGVSSVGGHIAIGNTALSCQQFDISAEDFEDFAFALDDQGDNFCGCPDATGLCEQVGGSAEPPDPIGGLE